MTELLRKTLIELTEALRARSVSPVELMEAVFARIDQTNSDLNAIVSERDRSQILEEARAAERRIAAGEARPLEGIPFGVKDLEDVAGMVTSQGSVLFKDAVAAKVEEAVKVFEKLGHRLEEITGGPPPQAATVRAGLSNAGLPVGMQIVAPLQRDDLALQMSRVFERERPWHPHWPSDW